MSINVPLKKGSEIKFEEIIAYDPGGTTGYARLKIDYELKTITIIEIGEFNTWDKVWDDIDALVLCDSNEDEREKVCIVYESFTIRTLNANLIPVEVIGVIRSLCLRHHVYHFPQAPHERKVSEIWYPELIHFPSHYGSAVRHGILFAVRHLFNSRVPKLIFNLTELKNNFVS